MNNSKKYELEISGALVSVLIGAMFLFCPFLGFNKCKVLLAISFGLLTIVNLIVFLVTGRDKDNEGLYTFGANLILLILTIILKLTELNLSMMLLLYTMFLSLIRLKKADFYHDRRNRIWQINVITLGALILTGILTSINMYYQSEIQIIMYGYFFLINGILELVDPLVLFLKD